jgi:hypothetical protein
MVQDQAALQAVQSESWSIVLKENAAQLRYVQSPIAPFNLKDDPSASPIEFIDEQKGFDRINEYEKYDPEPGDDERMKMAGFHIVESRIELTDSSGRNRTIVKRI